jgi:hypothetical protein
LDSEDAEQGFSRSAILALMVLSDCQIVHADDRLPARSTDGTATQRDRSSKEPLGSVEIPLC